MVFHVDFNELPVARSVRVLQGDTYCEPYELKLNDAVLDLTGATITLAVRRAPGRGAVVAKHEIAADNAVAGTFTAVVAAGDTAQMLGEHWYEVEIAWAAGSPAFADGCVKTVVAGGFSVYEDALH
jgi:hypothetical protein